MKQRCHGRNFIGADSTSKLLAFPSRSALRVQLENSRTSGRIELGSNGPGSSGPTAKWAADVFSICRLRLQRGPSDSG